MDRSRRALLTALPAVTVLPTLAVAEPTQAEAGTTTVSMTDWSPAPIVSKPNWYLPVSHDEGGYVLRKGTGDCPFDSLGFSRGQQFFSFENEADYLKTKTAVEQRREWTSKEGLLREARARGFTEILATTKQV